MVLIKIGYEGKRIQEYALNEGVRVFDVLHAAGIMLSLEEKVYLASTDKALTSDDSVLDRSVLIIKKPSVVQVRVSKIGQALSTVNVQKHNTIRQALREKGIIPNTTDEVWIHFDGIEKGVLATSWDQVIVPGAIYIVEPRKTLQGKIERIIRDCNNADYSEEAIANTICVMLTRDYNIR